MTPLAGFLYQPLWMGAFTNQEIKTGASWSYEADGNTLSFVVTGTDEYAGYEGYVIEATFQGDDFEGTAEWETCINFDLPLPLMTDVTTGEGETFYIELTGYTEE
ncbi:hypothetical protein [Anaerophaga thermohalophila]|jgi:hypothetical protein|uniref:hypothetical protein n=1 Tax=Anaerophaga thermohalophila TaxID=177400 RepID=UPI000304E1CC|nr:hypothetical protein [Anaerophaga thermohalophila]